MMRQKEPALGLYIHIPFCKSKCSYCDFYSLPNCEEKMDAYVQAIEKHLKEVAPQASHHIVDTVYFGGGTPSYLGEGRLIHILKCIKKMYHVDKNAEITMEANPDSLGNDKTVHHLHKAGFNRFSLGVQTSDDTLLKTIGRVHTWDQVVTAVESLRKAKIENYSLDLIYGLPGQTLDGWKKTLADAISLEPKHLSCYGLKLEEGTPLERDKGKYRFADDDEQADMYLYTVETLKENGYEQYEVSNFAKKGYASRHNLKYWKLEEYAGFGPAAYSDFGGVRYGYTRDIDRYIAGELVLAESEELLPMERDLEYIMLSLRTVDGIDSHYYEYTYRQPFLPMEKLFTIYETAQMAERTKNGWRLTAKGFLVSNQIIGNLQEAVGKDKERRLDKAYRRDYRIGP